MDDSTKEMVKAVAEALKPFAGLAERLFGGAFDQIGGTWEDKLKVRRDIRRLKLFEKLRAAFAAAGFEPQPIPDSIWLPAVQEALLQDDDTLQSKWAAMLANSADPRGLNQVHPAFPSILKELSPGEVKFLDALYEGRTSSRHPSVLSEMALLQIYAGTGLAGPDLPVHAQSSIQFQTETVRTEREKFSVALEILLKHKLLERISKPQPITYDPARVPYPQRSSRAVKFEIKSTELISFTRLGVAFVKACQTPPPSKREADSSR
jgi:hypothetical protein